MRAVDRGLLRGVGRLPEAAARALLIAGLTPVSVLYDRVGRSSRFRSEGARRTVPRVAASDVDLSELLRERRPVIIEGLHDRIPPSAYPGLENLRTFASSTEHRFPVRLYDRDRPYFLYVGDYGLELDHIVEMDLADFLAFLFDAGSSDQYAVYQYFPGPADRPIRGALEELAATFASASDQPPETGASGVWIGGRGAVTPLHLDLYPGLLFQTHGRKRIVMYAPTDKANLYFRSAFAVGQRWSDLPARSGEATDTDFPLYRRVTAHEGVLEAGETLVVPPFWSHEMEALEANISVPLRFTPRRRDYLHPLSQRAQAEVFHRRYVEPVRARLSRSAGRV